MNERKPGMFSSPGQAAGYFLAWLVILLLASGLVLAIVFVWRWALHLAFGV